MQPNSTSCHVSMPFVGCMSMCLTPTITMPESAASHARGSLLSASCCNRTCACEHWTVHHQHALIADESRIGVAVAGHLAWPCLAALLQWLLHDKCIAVFWALKFAVLLDLQMALPCVFEQGEFGTAAADDAKHTKAIASY